MKIRSFWGILVIISAMFCNSVAAMAEPNVSTDGNCQFDDAAKRKIADAAYSAAMDAHNTLARIINKVAAEYDNSSGACHYLSNTSGKWWKEFAKGELSFTSKDKSGARVVDTLKPRMRTPATLLIDRMNGDVLNREINMKDYTDWDFEALKKRAREGNAEINKIANWLANAREGETSQNWNSDTYRLICNSVHCSQECDMMIKLSGNGVACCNWTMINSTSRSSDGQSGTCRESDMAFKYNNYQDLINALVSEDSKAEKCLKVIGDIQALRGSSPNPDPNSFIGKRKAAHEGLAVLSGEADISCKCKLSEDGHMTNEIASCTAADADFEEDNFERPCKTIGEYQAEFKNTCVACGLMSTILGAVQKISKNAFDAISSHLIGLLSLGFLIYIAYITLITIASPETQKISKFLTTLAKQGARVAVAIVLLQTPNFVYDTFVTPILDGGVDFSVTLMGQDKARVIELGSDPKYSHNFEKTGNYLNANLLETLVGATATFSNEATLMPAIGRSFYCWSWTDLGWKRAWIIPRFTMLVEGIIMWAFGIMIWLAIGFYVLDCVIQMGIVCSLMAFFIACWPFKMTSEYTKIGWNMFLNTFFNFVMMGVVVTTINEMITQAIATGMTEGELEQYLNEDMIEELDAKLELFGLQIVMLVICCMMCMKLSDQAGALANKFAGGARIKMGGDLAGLATSAATSVAKNAGGAALKGAGAFAGSVAEHTGAKAAVNKGKEQVRNLGRAAKNMVRQAVRGGGSGGGGGS